MSAYPKERDEDLLHTFKSWFKQVMDVEAKQRKREEEDLRFQVDAWDPEARTERKGKDGLPGQPTLHISLTKQPIQLVKNQAQAADLGIEIHPVSEKAVTETAETMQDHYRAIERDSNAEQVRLWGFDRGVQCGRGYWRVDMVYDPDSDHEHDQKIVINRVLDGSRVGFDPSARQLDLSDANHAFVWEWMDLDSFKDEYPDAEISSYTNERFAELVASDPDWVEDSGDRKAVQVAEVWRKKKRKTTICLVKQGREFVNVPKAEVGKRKVYATKVKEDVTLCWYKITANTILEYEEYEGLSLIPIIPFLANELQPFDGERRFEGMVRPAKDGQRAFDYAISSAVADVGRLSKIPYIGPRGTFTDPKWNSANVRNWSYIEYEPIGSDGQPIPPPQPMQVDGTKLALSLQLAEMAKGLVQAATAVYDPSLGETPKKGQSGRAVIAQQQQSDAGTSNYLQTLANIAMRYEARCVLERMVYGYDRAGRIVSLRGPEDELKQVMLNAPYVMGEDGRPQRVQGRNVKGAKFIDYSSGGKYGVAISVGKSYQTRLQQGQEQFGELLPNLPPELQVLLLPTYMRFRDSPGSKEAADLMAKFRDSKFPGLVGKEGEQPTPDQLQAKLQGMEQQTQEMQQQLQMAIQEIKTDQAKQQAAMFKAQLDAQTALEKARIDAAAKINVAQIKAETDGNAQATEAHTESIALGQEMVHESLESARQREHERQMQHENLSHEVGMAGAQGNSKTFSREGGQEEDSEQSREQNEGSSRESSQEASTPQGEGGE